MPNPTRRFPVSSFAMLVILLLTAGCGSSTGTDKAAELRLGYFPNVTHAAAIVGFEKGLFARQLGPGTRLSTRTFNAGPTAVEALLTGAVDAAYLGPNPAINAFSKSNGAVRIISGATSGGAALVVKPNVNSASDLKGKSVATPQLGNTQDVALRTWLSTQGLKTDTHGGGDVRVVPQDNAQSLQTFQSGDIQGAWVPEPWATRLVKEGGGKTLVDERQIWPSSRFATTVLVVRTEFAKKNPSTVKRLLEGHIAATDYLTSNGSEAQDEVNSGIEKITQKKLPASVIAESWKSLTFTTDPILGSLTAGARNAETLGLLEKVDLSGITDLSLLNDTLREEGRPVVDAR